MIMYGDFDELVTIDTATNAGFANVMVMFAAVPDLNSGDRAAVATAAVEGALMSSSRIASSATQDRNTQAMDGSMVQNILLRIASNQEQLPEKLAATLAEQLALQREEELDRQIAKELEL